MWDIARSAVMGKPKEEEVATGEASTNTNGLGCGEVFLARVLGSVSAILVMVIGFLSLISCPQWAIYMMCLGSFTLLLEASFVAGLCDCSENFAQLLGRINPWMKAIFYPVVSFLPLVGCFGITTLICCGAWFGTGVAYFCLALKQRRHSTASASYKAGDEEAHVELIAAAASEEKDSNVNGGEEQSAWWPFPSTPSKSRSGAAESVSADPTSDSKATGATKPAVAEPPKPAFTGTIPDSVSPAFPTLPGSSAEPRTIPYTGPVPKAAQQATATALTVPPPSAASPATGSGPRTIAYSGPLLKPIGGV